MTRASGRALTVGLSLITGAGLLSGCTNTPTRTTVIQHEKLPTSGDFRLLAFDSCDTALTTLREAGRATVGPFGLPGQYDGRFASARGGVAVPSMAMPDMAMDGKAAAPQAEQVAPGYSGTNNHEAGVDEPDLVKTDGRRVVTLSGGVLRVIDVASRRQVGRLELSGSDDPNRRYAFNPANMLLSGDRALILLNEPYFYPQPLTDKGIYSDEIVEPIGPAVRLLLVDLAGPPQVLGSYKMDGGLVDAREVGGTARVVVRSSPRLNFPQWREGDTDTKRTKANQRVVDKSGLDDWLPRYEVSSDGRTTAGRVPCEAVARPDTFTGANMLTVLSFELGAGALGDGDPLTLVADGDTVYGTGTSLYIASDQRWREVPFIDVRPDGSTTRIKPAEPRTDIYRFDTSAPGQPRFTAAGTVPGYLINQYAMSEWDGRLRVATTTGSPWLGASGPRSESAVYVLAPTDRELVEVGHVDGLGKGERIYAVRFVGTVGYVVTFRQTDPLYTLDLTDPARPTLRGELKINGYSAYLHPAGAGRVIGVGQDANDQGRTRGTQVSLFDVANLDDPTRVAAYTVKNGHSEAEFDPHAFLYWATDGLLVVPLQQYRLDGSQPKGGALVLRLAGDRIDEIGQISHPAPRVDYYDGYGSGMVRRSFVIDQTLWTVSDAGVQVNDSFTLDRLAWIEAR